MAITWKNVAAPSFAGSAAAMGVAGAALKNAGTGFGNVTDDIRKINEQKRLELTNNSIGQMLQGQSMEDVLGGMSDRDQGRVDMASMGTAQLRQQMDRKLGYDQNKIESIDKGVDDYNDMYSSGMAEVALQSNDPANWQAGEGKEEAYARLSTEYNQSFTNKNKNFITGQQYSDDVVKGSTHGQQQEQVRTAALAAQLEKEAADNKAFDASRKSLKKSMDTSAFMRINGQWIPTEDVDPSQIANWDDMLVSSGNLGKLVEDDPELSSLLESAVNKLGSKEEVYSFFNGILYDDKGKFRKSVDINDVRDKYNKHVRDTGISMSDYLSKTNQRINGNSEETKRLINEYSNHPGTRTYSGDTFGGSSGRTDYSKIPVGPDVVTPENSIVPPPVGAVDKIRTELGVLPFGGPGSGTPFSTGANGPFTPDRQRALVAQLEAEAKNKQLQAQTPETGTTPAQTLLNGPQGDTRPGMNQPQASDPKSWVLPNPITELQLKKPETAGKITAAVEAAVAETGVDYSLIYAMMGAESDFNPNAVSGQNAGGLMQLAEDTAKEMGVKDRFNIAENIMGGAKYIKHLMDSYPNVPIEHIIAIYNTGPGNYDKHGFAGVTSPTYNAKKNKGETGNHVKKVMKAYNDFMQKRAGIVV